MYAFANGSCGAKYLVVFDPLEVFSKVKSQIYNGKQFEIGSLIKRHKNLYGFKTDPFFMTSSEGDFGSDKHSSNRLQNPDAPFSRT